MKNTTLKNIFATAGQNTGIVLLALLAVVVITAYAVSQRSAVTDSRSRATSATSCSLTVRITPPPTVTPTRLPTPICIVPPTGTATPTPTPTPVITPICIVPSVSITPTPTGIAYPGCSYTQGYWKTHPTVWPVPGLSLGTTLYSQAQLLTIFNAPVAGNGLIALAHQLIAAKLNIAGGTASDSIASVISQADAMIGGLVVPPVGTGSLSSSSVTALITALDNFNSGKTGPGHCNE